MKSIVDRQRLSRPQARTVWLFALIISAGLLAGAAIGLAVLLLRGAKTPSPLVAAPIIPRPSLNAHGQMDLLRSALAQLHDHRSPAF